ncbi:GNAT family N-acetyltransferase [Kitasatospora sp. DSM 101779]|uniref:GNAT family N-acetyltransferase n=1 Tax=Kitasatospora sp. DSM 101779 TaxID=2853165 RepID=UPI0021D87525|nr:GNAT family N-acetyltransferase [Kitasatospora sp. DSM 101779]MCU7823056.1 GNAT family N-acetyltransferase [Kitasatospora sp. DSM 101779]
MTTNQRCAVRPAGAADAPELVRLRALMFAAMAAAPGDGPEEPGGEGPDGPWRATAERMLRERLAVPGELRTLQAYVVDDPDRPGRLAACAIGTLEERLPAPGHPDGRFGFVFTVSTDPGRRRRGHARACIEALIGWFDGRRVTRIDLHATADGEDLYRGLGFGEHARPLSRQRLIAD